MTPPGPGLLQDPIAGLFLQIVAVLIVVLLVATLILAGLLIAFRAAGRRRDRRHAALEAAWRPPLLDIVNGDGDPDRLHALVGRRDQSWFLRFLARYGGRVKGRALERIQQIAAPYLESTRQDLGHDLPEVRADAAHVLGLLGGPDQLPLLERCLDDPAPLVGMTAAGALAHIQDPRLTRAVLNRVDRWDRRDAKLLGTLLATSRGDVVPVLLERLEDPDASPRQLAVAAEALRVGDHAEAGAVAARLLQERRISDPDALSSLLRLLGAVGRREHVECALLYTTSDLESVRAQAVRALGRLGSHDDHALLVRAVSDPSPWVALTAVGSLSRIGEQRTLQEIARKNGPGAVFARQALREDERTA